MLDIETTIFSYLQAAFECDSDALLRLEDDFVKSVKNFSLENGIARETYKLFAVSDKILDTAGLMTLQQAWQIVDKKIDLAALFEDYP